MSMLETTMFYEMLHDKYWGEYARNCESEGVKASFKGFLVWCEEKGLVPDGE